MNNIELGEKIVKDLNKYYMQDDFAKSNIDNYEFDEGKIEPGFNIFLGNFKGHKKPKEQINCFITLHQDGNIDFQTFDGVGYTGISYKQSDYFKENYLLIITNYYNFLKSLDY